MSANAATIGSGDRSTVANIERRNAAPPDSGDRVPRRVPRPACQRFGSRHHRTRRPCAGSERRHHRTPQPLAGSSPRLSAGKDSPPDSGNIERGQAVPPFDRVPEASAVRPWRPSARPAPVASRPRRIRHHRRKRGANARHCARPCRTGSRPSRRAVRLQGRLTPLESVRQFRPMSAGKDSGKPRNRSTAPEASGLSAVRKSPPSNAGTPPPSEAATVCRKRTPPPSNAATVGRKFAAPVSGQGFAAGFRQHRTRASRPAVRPWRPCAASRFR